MIERTNRYAKGNDEKLAARSKADAAEPLGISLYLSRGGNGFISSIAISIAIFFRAVSRLFSSLRRLLSFVDYLRHYLFQAF